MDSISIRGLCGVYTAMLYAYPRDFRRQYGAEMQQVFRDRCREQSGASWLAFSGSTAMDWIASVIRERRAASLAVSAQMGAGRKLIQEWAVTLLLFLFVTTTMVQAYVVPTGSMENNILIGDHMLVDKVGFSNTGNNWTSYVLPTRQVKRGDIIAFRFPEDVRQTFVKRVIGLPGDRIHLQNKRVIRNGQPLDEPYAQHVTSYIDDDRDNFPTAAAPAAFAHQVQDGDVIVPPDMLFVLGDNRDDSLDSRYWGFVPRDYIVGKPLVIYWSYDGSTKDFETWNIAHLEDVALHFFTKTRWSRTLTTP
jgi:signal peptidase I